MEFRPVPGQPAHFSINADDVERAKAFYSAVFDWKFHAWGPPGFYMIETSPAESKPVPVLSSLQGRRALDDGGKIRGWEGTIAVADVDETVRLVEANGGKIVMPRCTLPGIGHLIFFEDPEGNLSGAMQYESGAE